MNTLKTDIEIKILHFMLQKARLCVNLAYVDKVLPLMQVDAMPGAENYIVGLMNLGGQSVPLIDLATRVGIERTESYSLDTPVLLCKVAKHSVGIIVDRIIGLSDIKENELQKNPELNTEDSLFSGTVPFKLDISLMVNMQKILNVKITGQEEIQPENVNATAHMD